MTDPTGKIFTGYAYSFSIPAQSAVTGITGSVSITGNGNGLSEALIIVGYAPGACVPNGMVSTDLSAIVNTMPGYNVMATFIVKAYGSETQTVSPNIQFPEPFAVNDGCIFAILDGGFLQSGTLQMTTNLNVLYTTDPSASGFMVSMDDEFCFAFPGGCELSSSGSATFVSSHQVNQSGTVVAVYGDVSEGVLSPAGGSWSITHNYYVDPGCSQFSPGLYGPGNYSVPSSAVSLYSTTLAGGPSDTDLQPPIFQLVNTPVQAGDCLVHLITGNVVGPVDAESQLRAMILPRN